MAGACCMTLRSAPSALLGIQVKNLRDLGAASNRYFNVYRVFGPATLALMVDPPCSLHAACCSMRWLTKDYGGWPN
ncbi:hypothetical protein MUK42_32864 [Musa troglodytarum]|uniref:Uncharacterized protein n=1 Tax=Musa troglodytarum TaxID=320322 RepID=A0A9E7JTQ7_9LILI|nr:hypothetical protein MUK42_32864 [Musa troglodytarum]